MTLQYCPAIPISNLGGMCILYTSDSRGDNFRRDLRCRDNIPCNIYIYNYIQYNTYII